MLHHLNRKIGGNYFISFPSNNGQYTQKGIRMGAIATLYYKSNLYSHKRIMLAYPHDATYIRVNANTVAARIMHIGAILNGV